LDEDYGFVTVEAFASGKPVITCTDSGGPAELVANDVNGKVCLPRPETLATALRQLTEDAQTAERLGRAGLEQVSQMTWGKAVRRLLAT
jgi:glycosyltransferase involved in cell wall biosynthesis